MTAAGLDEVRRELERLRDRTRRQVEQRLREARPYGEVEPAACVSSR